MWHIFLINHSKFFKRFSNLLFFKLFANLFCIPLWYTYHIIFFLFLSLNFQLSINVFFEIWHLLVSYSLTISYLIGNYASAEWLTAESHKSCDLSGHLSYDSNCRDTEVSWNIFHTYFYSNFLRFSSQVSRNGSPALPIFYAKLKSNCNNPRNGIFKELTSQFLKISRKVFKIFPKNVKSSLQFLKFLEKYSKFPFFSSCLICFIYWKFSKNIFKYLSRVGRWSKLWLPKWLRS